MWCSSIFFPCCHLPAYLESRFFQIKYFITNEIWYCIFLGCSVWTTTLTPKCHKCLEIMPSLCREQMGPEWVVWLLSEFSRPTCYHVNGLMSIKPCDTMASLWKQSGFFDPILEALTLTYRGLDVGKPGLLFWRYSDIDINILQIGGTIRWTVLSPSLASGPPLFSGSWGKTQLYKIAVWSWYLLKGHVCQSPKAFSYMWTRSCP